MGEFTQEDRELLIRLDERTQIICRKQDDLKKDFQEHLKKHWQVTMAGVGCIITSFAAAAFSIFK